MYISITREESFLVSQVSLRGFFYRLLPVEIFIFERTDLIQMSNKIIYAPIYSQNLFPLLSSDHAYCVTVPLPYHYSPQGVQLPQRDVVIKRPKHLFF
jgi:hypothetical protein